MAEYRDPKHIDPDKEYQISELVKFIREKMYGIDVRESIALALERVYDDAAQNGNANMEVARARGNEKVLGDRLDKMQGNINDNTSELTQTLTQTEFDSWIATLLDGGPSIFYDTLSALEADYPNGASGVALVRETNPAKIYVWNPVDNYWQNYGDYQGFEVKDRTISTKKIAYKAVTENETDFAQKGKNLFDGQFLKGVILTGSPVSGGFVEERDGGISAVLKLAKGQTYNMSRSLDTDRFSAAASVGYPDVGKEIRYISNVNTSEERSFTLQGDEDHIFVYLSSPTENKIPSKFQVEKGNERTTYEPPNFVKVNLTESSVGGYELKPNSIEMSHLAFDIENTQKKYYIEDNLCGEYEPKFTFLDPDVVDDVTQLYAVYDDLVDRHPDYVTKTELGLVTNNLPLYEYRFKPNLIGGLNKIPKIPITQGIHGMEKKASVGSSRFWIDLCDNWYTNKLLRALRWNVEFIVIPMANPSAFNLNQRKNANGVDIARNFTEGWNQQGDNGNPDSMYYAGPSPRSELETQILESWINNNADALFTIDVHNYTSLSASDSLLWTASDSEFVNKFSAGYVQMQSSIAQGKYRFSNRQGQALGYVRDYSAGGSITKQWHSVGVNSSILELVAFMNNSQPDIQELTASSLGNYILSSLRNFT